MKAFFSLTTISLFFLVLSCNSKKEEPTKVKIYEPAEPIKVDLVERGNLLVNAIGCHDCHSPKIFNETGMHVDPEKILSGHPSNEKLESYDANTASKFILFSMGGTASIGPWGTSFGANLTSDDTGIGTWSEAQFLKAIKHGKYKGLDGSRNLLPLMPWEAYRNLPDDDLKAIFAYLKTVNPVENVVPAAIPPKMN
jgi:hypothetical protein